MRVTDYIRVEQLIGLNCRIIWVCKKEEDIDTVQTAILGTSLEVAWVRKYSYSIQSTE